MQAHDELLFVVPDAEVARAREVIAAEMVREPDWLPGIPLEVETGTGVNYGEAK